MISIVIIGKNEVSNLPKLFYSLQELTISHEVIYVDSASCDNSVNVSKEFCNKVIVLEESQLLCAAAGRSIGTKYTRYDWILYLDGDMELENQFIEFLNNKDFLRYEATVVGFIGYYNYLYNDGSNDQNRLLQPKNKIVEHFGGAVMLKKDAVLKAGNWNPSVVANEEIDLYVRIQSLGYKVFGLDKNMVKHIAKKESNIQTLISLFVPKNRRFYGFGQVLVSQYQAGTFFLFLKKKIYPFVYLLLICISVFYPYCVYLIVIVFLMVSIRKRWYYNLIYISDIVRGIAGILTFRVYTPMVEKIYDK